jgi:hypothetical protein
MLTTASRCALACAFLTATATAAAWAHAEQLGIDFWHAGEQRDRLEWHEREAAALMRELEVVRAKGDARHHIIEAVIRGDTTVEAAARAYLAINGSDSDTERVIRRQYFPGETDFDSAVTQVKGNVARYLADVKRETGGREGARREDTAARAMASGCPTRPLQPAAMQPGDGAESRNSR